MPRVSGTPSLTSWLLCQRRSTEEQQGQLAASSVRTGPEFLHSLNLDSLEYRRREGSLDLDYDSCLLLRITTSEIIMSQLLLLSLEVIQKFHISHVSTCLVFSLSPPIDPHRCEPSPDQGHLVHREWRIGPQLSSTLPPVRRRALQPHLKVYLLYFL